MGEAIAELLNRLGYGSIITLFIVIVVKYVLKPYYDGWLNLKKEEKVNLIQTQQNKELNIQANALEFDKYKKDEVLPVLKEVANIIEEYRDWIQDYNNYLYAELKEDSIPQFLELQLKEINEIKLDKTIDFKKYIRKINMYIPAELRKILLTIQVSIENEFLSIKHLELINDTKLNDYNINTIILNNVKIFEDYLECYYKIIENYIHFNSSIKYQDIMKEFNIDEKGEYISRTEPQDYCSLYILAVKRKPLSIQREMIQKMESNIQ